MSQPGERCTCNDCPLHGVSMGGLADASFETDVFTEDDDFTHRNTSLDDAESDFENMPPLVRSSSPSRSPLLPIRSAPFVARAGPLAARATPLVARTAPPAASSLETSPSSVEPSSPATSSYQSSSPPRPNREMCVIFMRPNFDKVDPAECASPTSSAPPSPAKRRAIDSPPATPVVSRSSAHSSKSKPPAGTAAKGKAKAPATFAKAKAKAPIGLTPRSTQKPLPSV